jgi:hypothetical protein
VFEDRERYYNLVIEVNCEIRKSLVDRKLKVVWHVQNSNDYLSVTRCNKINKYKHRPDQCFGEVTWPHCAQSQKYMKERK